MLAGGAMMPLFICAPRRQVPAARSASANANIELFSLRITSLCLSCQGFAFAGSVCWSQISQPAASAFPADARTGRPRSH